MSTNRALITGITGQDGSYLAEFLPEKSYQVIGMVRRSSTVNFERIEHIQDRITLVSGDPMDQVSLIDIVKTHLPTKFTIWLPSHLCQRRGPNRFKLEIFPRSGSREFLMLSAS